MKYFISLSVCCRRLLVGFDCLRREAAADDFFFRVEVFCWLIVLYIFTMINFKNIYFVYSLKC